MARKRKYRPEADKDPELDISSLVDVAFLLLIYFLVTSTLRPDAPDLSIVLPTQVPTENPDKVDPVVIVIGPNGNITYDGQDLDNSGTKGFDVAYAPESAIDLQDADEGKNGNIRWFDHSSEDPYGLLDLNTIMPEKYKGAIAYAHTTFESDKKQSVDIRLGCINGNKIWVNGNLITSNHVYHANTSIDQYIARATLNKGRNDILVKIAQNEQEESWAQRWQFQLRICDEFGLSLIHI